MILLADPFGRYLFLWFIIIFFYNKLLKRIQSMSDLCRWNKKRFVEWRNSEETKIEFSWCHDGAVSVGVRWVLSLWDVSKVGHTLANRKAHPGSLAFNPVYHILLLPCLRWALERKSPTIPRQTYHFVRGIH